MVNRIGEEKIKFPVFSLDNYNSLYDNLLQEKLERKKRENIYKNIFSSHVFYENNSFVDSSLTPKNSKITNKGEDIAINEVLKSNRESKKFRRNTCHQFSGITGFYLG